jgi:hypothetical protein
MQTHRRIKLEILVEAPLVRRVSELLTSEGVSNYVVLHADGGKDASGAWSDTGVTSAMERRMILAVCRNEAADKVLARLGAFFERYPGAVYRSDVDVLRSERF